MKYVWVVFLCGLVLAEENPSTSNESDYIEEIMEECSKETGVTEKEAMNAFNSTDPPTAPQKCYLKCAMEKIGIINSESEPQTEMIQELINYTIKDDDKKISKEAIDAMVGRCSIDQGEDECEKAYLLKKCFDANYKLDF
ncbi:odorant binding protein [Rhyzopertha dominica]|uniref:Pheromone-binding protein 1 n=1 Tax=Rhyzopertha dominica TaxID=92692 RepID=A0A109NPJ4_RHYDO|nr:pheromone-binding protein 1 [Rhyzopertha dominica]KAI7815285.1 odorant binding protein [Rhyzopertha dominica]